MLEYCREKNLRLVFHTNGTLLKGNAAYAIVFSSVSEIVISIYGVDDDSYSSVT